MGYYTTFHADIVLQKNIPNELTELLTKLIHGAFSDNPALPSHPLFECYRWSSIFSKSAFWDESPSFVRLPSGYYKLSVRAVFQNKNDEINKFLDWISTFIAGHKKQNYVGWKQGEGDHWGRTNLYINR